MAPNNQPRSYQQWPNATYAPTPVSVTPPDFNLDAGVYGLTLTAGAWGSATLQKLLDGTSTYVTVAGAVVVGDGYATFILPAGQYRLVLAGITALVGEIALISRGGLFQ